MKNKFTYLFFLFFLNFQTILNAQFNYQNIPELQVNVSRGCVPLTVTFTGVNTTISGAVSVRSVAGTCVDYTFNYGDRRFSTNQPETIYTYTSPGIYVITGLGSCDGGNKAFKNNVTIEVLPKPDPEYTVLGCQSLTGKVNITNSQYDFYDIEWGDGNFSNSVSGSNIYSHIYANSNVRFITLTGTYLYTVSGFQQSCKSNPIIKKIQVYPPLYNPEIEVLEIKSKDNLQGIVNLQLKTDDKLKYAIFVRNGINDSYKFIQSISSIGGSNIFTINGLNTNSVQTFKVFAFDDCGTTTTGVEVSSILANATADASKNTINWNNNYSPIDNIRYDLLLSNTIINSQNLQNFSSNILQTMQAFDSNVECNVNYCYQVVGTKQNAPFTKSISAETCVQGLKPATISGILGFNSSYENSKLFLFWKPSTSLGLNYKIYGIKDSNKILLTQTTNTITSNIDSNYDCYAIIGEQTCGQSPEKITCPIKITGKKDNIVQNSLQWTNYKNGDNLLVTQAEIEWYSENFTFINKDNLSNNQLQYLHNPIDENNQKVKYRIKNILTDGVILYSDYQDIIQDLRLYPPTSFTPNEDGKNDTYFPKGLFWKEYNIDIFNRWGEKIFTSTKDYEGWNGAGAIPGLYSYAIRVEDFYGNVIRKNGTLTLIR